MSEGQWATWERSNWVQVTMRRDLKGQLRRQLKVQKSGDGENMQKKKKYILISFVLHKLRDKCSDLNLLKKAKKGERHLSCPTL